MTVQAAKTLYREEFIAAFEQSMSDLAHAATPESMADGLSVTWLVAGSGGQRAVTRGQSGLIPFYTPSNTQVTATLVEHHAPFQLTGFDIFASQGNQRQIMQDASMSVIRREQDYVILAELANATQDYPASATTADLSLFAGAKAALGVAFVDTNETDNMFTIISPAAEAYLVQTTEFASADYREVKPLEGDVSRSYRNWMGLNWIVSPLVSGVGTAAEVLYMYHRRALGYAFNMGAEKVNVGFDEKQEISWSRATIYQAAKILQNTGIIKIPHDGSAFATT